MSITAGRFAAVLIVAGGAILGATSARADVCDGIPCAGPGAKTTSTLTSASVLTVVDTPVSVTIDTFRTELTGRLLNGPSLYDQTFMVPFSDGSILGVVMSIEALLRNSAADPIQFNGPNLVSSAATNSTNTTVVKSSTDMVFTGFRTSNGPTTIPDVSFLPGDTSAPSYGTLTCMGISAPVSMTGTGTGTFLNGVFPTGCTGGGSFFVRAGSSNVDTEITTVTTVAQTTTTTLNRLTTQVYEVVGVPSAGQVAVAEPGSLAVLAAGLLAFGVTGRRAATGGDQIDPGVAS